MKNRSFDFIKRLKQLGIGLLVGIPMTGWGLVLGVKASAGPYGWWLLMAFGVIAALIAIGCIVCQGIKLIHGKKLSKIQVGVLAWSLFAAWPGGWLLGIGRLPYPSTLNSVGPSAVVSLPFEMSVQTGWGGDSLATNHHAWLPVQRWAYDFVIPITANPAASVGVNDYPIYGASVYAPADGIVVGTLDTQRDVMPDAPDLSERLGNYIVIKMDQTQTYLVLAHLKQDSVTVAVGDHLKAGELIGRVGNSGSNSEPHLHIHHQRQNPMTYPMLLSEGLPLYFITQEGKSMPIGGKVQQGQISVPNGDWVSPLKISQ